MRVSKQPDSVASSARDPAGGGTPTSPGSGLGSVANASGVRSPGPTEGSSGGGPASTGTRAVKKEQNNRLLNLKRSTIAAVIIMDIILVASLSFQLISLKQSLCRFLNTKVKNQLAFYGFQYNERFEFSELGLSLYQNNSFICDALFNGDEETLAEVQGLFMHDQKWRTSQLIALVNTSGYLVTSSAPDESNGHGFGIGSIVEYYMEHFGGSGSPLRTSVMIDRDAYQMFASPHFEVAGEPRLDLASWDTQDQSLALVVLAPVYCGHRKPQGFVVNVDAITPRDYDQFAQLTLTVKWGMGGILAKSARTHEWQTAFSHNQPGPDGAKTRFPDVSSDVFTSNQLQAALSAGPGNAVTGTFIYEDVSYTYAMQMVPAMSIGAVPVPEQSAITEIVFFYAEPEAPVRHVLNSAMSWQIPWMLILLLWSVLSVNFVLRKFIIPMQNLIESVNKKRMKEFNELLRTLKANKSAIWALLFKVTVVELVLLGLIYINSSLLNSAFPDFTSSITVGKLLSYVVTSRSNSLLYYLASWSMDPMFALAAMNTTWAAESFTQTLRHRQEVLNVDAICVIGMDSRIIASSHSPSIMQAFPETGIMRQFRRQLDEKPFFSHSAWDVDDVNMTTGMIDHVATGDPALVRLIATPIRPIRFNTSTESVQYGDLLGAVVMIRFLNGEDSIWRINTFAPGYSGMYMWDRYHRRFLNLTSVLKRADGLEYGVDIAAENPGLLQGGVASEYNQDRVIVQEARVSNKRYTTSIMPFGRSDEVVLSPSAVNAYLIRGLPKSDWNAVEDLQLSIQIGNMVIVILSAVIKLVLAWLPLRRFLQSMERAFTLQSLSDDGIAKREQAAAAMLEKGARPSSGRVKSSSMVVKV